MALSVSSSSEDRKTNCAWFYQLVIGEGSRALRNAFDKRQPSSRLKEELNVAKQRLESKLRNGKKKILNDRQWELLFPASGEPSYNDLDITLLFVLLKNGVGNLHEFNPPPNGWDEMPDETDKSPEANFVRIKCYRNELCHFPAAEIETSKFESWWKNASEAIIALGADKNEIENIKTKPVDHDFQQEMLKEIQKIFKERLEDISTNVTGNLDIKKPDVTTELPGQVQNFIGGKDNVNKILELFKDSKTNAILLKGGPGYGKTTIAIEAAHEIAKETAVKFCPLRKYANSFPVLLRQISFVCTGELQKQTKNDPGTAKYSLLKWCKNLETPFVLLLDDIEEVLEQHREEVTNLLEEMSTSSNRQIKFLLTSRTELASTTLFSVIKVDMEPLSTAHSVELITQSFKNFKLTDKAENESVNDGNIEKLEQVAKLCDCVPLALSIAGALLNDFKVEELIAKLRNNPLKALKDTVSGKSVEYTIATSFKNLDERSKKSLISLSVFRGAFNEEAAKALLDKNCEKTLRFFKARSLLQSESNGKYLMHSLIQCYVQDVSKEGDSYVSHYHETERKYFDYFLELLRKNSKLFWSKNGCKKSIELFNDDRIHTEHAITSFSRFAQSSQVVNETSAEEFQRIFRYVRMCVPPRLYESLLRSVLETAKNKSDVFLQLQVLCRLGNETREKTLGEELTRIMEQANEIRLKNKTEFESKTNKQIELFFWNIYIRYLNEMASQGSDNISDIDDARKSREITHSSHCKHEGDETMASTHMYDELGIELYTTDKSHEEAKKMFVKSLSIKKRELGDHIFTFSSLKKLSDLELHRKNYVSALEYSEAAKEMLEKLNIANGKESILPLKNMSSCFMFLEKYDEAKTTLQKAITIAEENIAGDHYRKLLVKSQEAILCQKMGQQNAQEAIEMAERLGRSAEWPSRDIINKIVNFAKEQT